MKRNLLRVAAAICIAVAGWLIEATAATAPASPAGDAVMPPRRLVVVTDDNYPPYLFRDERGDLRGIVKDKWELWSRTTGVPVEVRGLKWSKAQQEVLAGEIDVIEALAYTETRRRQFAFSRTPATVEARVFFHRSITGIHDVASLRGFAVAAKEGSACAEWLRARGIDTNERFSNSESLVQAAGRGEVRMFCMDSPAAEYFLFKQGLNDGFRQSPVLYSAPFDWAVRGGREDLRDFIQEGFAGIPPEKLEEIQAQWVGQSLRGPFANRYLLACVLMLALGLCVLLLAWNQSLRQLAYRKTSELLAVTESQRRQRAQARYLATRDLLTGLPNRSCLQHRLARTLARAKGREHLLAVIFVDLDRFKSINDTFGQDCGDLVLKAMADRLRPCVRPGDTIARNSGDEFVFILPDLAKREDASAFASKVLAAIRMPVDLSGRGVYCTASAGIAFFPNDGSTAADLIRNADIAMDCAKQAGRNNFQFFVPGMHDLVTRRHELEIDLRVALHRGEFEVVYQPKFAIATGAVSGFEALLRWRHPLHGLLTPAEFVPILEDTGLIVPIGEWVLRCALHQVKRWRSLGLTTCPIAVNLSARQFHQGDLDKVVARALAESGLDASAIELELTETSLMREPEEAARMLGLIADSGVRIAVDDFGTGYSSLGYLKRFPIDALKLDRSFIRGVAEDAEDAAIVKAIIELARSLGLKVIAEGVETREQLDFLARHGCDEAQGFLFSAAVDGPDTDEWLQRACAAPHQDSLRISSLTHSTN